MVVVHPGSGGLLAPLSVWGSRDYNRDPECLGGYALDARGQLRRLAEHSLP